MKTLLKLSFILLTLLASTFIISCDKDDETDTTPTTDIAKLSKADAEGLLFMREEEKLARDAYLYMFQAWNVDVFNNISESEQSHMDLLLERINQFELIDIASPDTGVFINADLQNLYNQLINQGKDSLVAALIVGAIIEDIDIADLERFIEATDNEDLKCTYDVLLIGSRNHLRSFIKNLNNNNFTYTPQFISQSQFDEIINGSHEKSHTCD